MNPVLNKKTFENVVYGNYETMSISGVVNKSFILWLILAAGAYLGWQNPLLILQQSLFWLIFAITVALCLVIAFNPKMSAYFSPLYAFGEGLFLGAITLFFEKNS